MSDNLTVRELKELLKGLRDEDEVLIAFHYGICSRRILGTVPEESRVLHGDGSQLVIATDGESVPFWDEDDTPVHLVGGSGD